MKKFVKYTISVCLMSAIVNNSFADDDTGRHIYNWTGDDWKISADSYPSSMLFQAEIYNTPCPQINTSCTLPHNSDVYISYKNIKSGRQGSWEDIIKLTRDIDSAEVDIHITCDVGEKISGGMITKFACDANSTYDPNQYFRTLVDANGSGDITIGNRPGVKNPL